MRCAAFSLAIAFALCVPGVAGTVVAVTDTSPVLGWIAFAGTSAAGTVGWSFQVGAASLMVNAVGLFDAGGTGFAQSHELGIWNSSNSLLLDVTIPAGTVDPLSGSYRFQSITPLVLNGGATYVIAAFYPGASADSVVAGAASGGVSSALTLLQSSQTVLSVGATFAEPNLSAGLSDGIFGPNFEFTPTPEPSGLALAGLGFAAVAILRKRRARSH